MHYAKNSFTRNGQDTITPIDPNTCIIERNPIDPLSINDINCIRKMYFGDDDACNSVSPTINRGPGTLSPTFNPTIKASEINSDQYFCLSGGNRIDGIASDTVSFLFNGEYKLSGLRNGKNYYIQSRQSAFSDPFYVYWNSNANLWFISTVLGADSYLASCNAADVTLCPNWMRESETVPLTQTKGECPRARCNSINVYSTYIDGLFPLCRGTFYYVQDNIFGNANMNKFWGFNDYLSQWICSESIEGIIGQNLVLANEESNVVLLNNLQDGGTLQIGLISTIDDENSMETLYISCTGCNGTQIYCPDITGPTSSPTVNTISPSNAPSMTPSMTPSITPTMGTNAPSMTPSLTPTKSTNEPSMAPTMETDSPTLIPSISPTITTEGPTINNLSNGHTHNLFYCLIFVVCVVMKIL